jgi:hypothetical protein
MDRVTKSFLTEFSKNNGYESLKTDVLFEHFSNYTVIEPKTEYLFDIEDINIGKNGTIGIDGFAILINKQTIDNIDELNDYLDQNKNCESEVIFIQSKTSAKFSSKEVGNFGFAVKDFIAEEQTLSWSDNAIEKIKLFNNLVERISELKENPKCTLYYISLGRNENDKNVLALVKSSIINIKEENIFSKVQMDLIDSNLLISKYKKIGQSIEKSFEFQNRVTLPVINNVKEAYLGIVDTKSIIELMTDENGEMLNVFYDNIRDYQGNNKVNNEITETLKSDFKDSFAILNNGITIVAENISTSRDKITISNYQIINGCQTSHVLFENKESLDDTVKVPIKLIISEDEGLTASVIRSTNRQTAIQEQDLLAFTKFQKSLEDFYQTFTGNEKLYYERRSKQYRSKNVERKRIIDKTTQIKAIASLYYDKPNLATRYFGAVFAELKDKLFKDNDQLLPYFVASFAIYKIEGLFRTGKIDKKYKKIKYYILTMFRHELNSQTCPAFNSKKSEAYSQEILEVLKDDTKTKKIISKVIKKIDSLSPDLQDSEISKSKDFVTKCLNLYGKKKIMRKKRS